MRENSTTAWNGLRRFQAPRHPGWRKLGARKRTTACGPLFITDRHRRGPGIQPTLAISDDRKIEVWNTTCPRRSLPTARRRPPSAMRSTPRAIGAHPLASTLPRRPSGTGRPGRHAAGPVDAPVPNCQCADQHQYLRYTTRQADPGPWPAGLARGLLRHGSDACHALLQPPVLRRAGLESVDGRRMPVLHGHGSDPDSSEFDAFRDLGTNPTAPHALAASPYAAGVVLPRAERRRLSAASGGVPHRLPFPATSPTKLHARPVPPPKKPGEYSFRPAVRGRCDRSLVSKINRVQHLCSKVESQGPWASRRPREGPVRQQSVHQFVQADARKRDRRESCQPLGACHRQSIVEQGAGEFVRVRLRACDFESGAWALGQGRGSDS
ncbi:hypothetical protein F4780DRAFT_128910 [Xylariomycetidae sp. FL0641]|nr:hypothetical protein F4780DRAFT_128910 [Xylariomycetidae sp. FL0641]